MKKALDALTKVKNMYDTLTTPQSIERIIGAMIVISIALIIFMAVFIFRETLQNQYTRARETILAVSTAGMVLATLILALGTFKIMGRDRGREDRDRKEKWINEIIDWASNTLDLGPTEDAGVLSLTGTQIPIYQLTKIKSLLNKGKHIYFISKSLDNNLEKGVKDTLSTLAISRSIAGGRLTFDEKLTPAQKKERNTALIKALVETETTIGKSSNEIIRIASDIKTSLLT